MKISKSARRGAKQLFRICLVNGVLDQGRVREVLRKVAEAKPRRYMAILSHFGRLVRLEIERRTARVASAVALPPEMAQSITNQLNQVYGQGLTISFEQDAALIGGLRVKVGSDVYDGSIQGRLARLAQSL
jgi:F-type H+-transporting ATPase subunit delta